MTAPLDEMEKQIKAKLDSGEISQGEAAYAGMCIGCCREIGESLLKLFQEKEIDPCAVYPITTGQP